MTDNLSGPIILQLSKKLAQELLCSERRETELRTKKEEENTRILNKVPRSSITIHIN